MNKIKFDHSKEKLSESLGISEDRYDEIFEACFSAVVSTENNTASKDIESAIKRLNPINESEFVFIGFQIGSISRKLEEINKKLLKTLL